MAAYYNEFDPRAAAWLRELIRRGLIADGEVDERSIINVKPVDLRGFTQCHFFAGIGGWSYAMRLAGWPDERPVWTGSPPCQPFSSAGRQLGRDDERHLAPHFISLVGAVRPPMLFGEQVASAAVFGGAAKSPKRGAANAPEWAWLDDLFDRLEAAHYACGASDIPAAGVGAPHIRQRTFFGAVRLADADIKGPQGWQRMSERKNERAIGSGGMEGGLADADSNGCCEGYVIRPNGKEHDAEHGGCAVSYGRHIASDSQWRDADWLFCRDERWRPVEPGTFPMAHGVSARVGRLRGYGNAIVPQAAAEFIKSFSSLTI